MLSAQIPGCRGWVKYRNKRERRRGGVCDGRMVETDKRMHTERQTDIPLDRQKQSQGDMLR